VRSRWAAIISRCCHGRAGWPAAGAAASPTRITSGPVLVLHDFHFGCDHGEASMVAIDHSPLTGVLLEVGGTLWSERWTPDPPLLAARMCSALPNASSIQLEMPREEFTRHAVSIDWSCRAGRPPVDHLGRQPCGAPSAARRCACCPPSDVSASRWPRRAGEVAAVGVVSVRIADAGCLTTAEELTLFVPNGLGSDPD
jgi:hypothetical protein